MNGKGVTAGLGRDSGDLLARLRREGVLRAATEAERAAGRSALPTGVSELDRALGGGLPRGRITEITGPLSSGRTAFLLGVLAAATSRGEQVGLIDPADAFDADAAAEVGVALERVLWVRPLGHLDACRAADLVLDAGGFGVVALDLSDASARPSSPKSGVALGGQPPRRRVPGDRIRSPSVWPRLARRAERSGSVLLVLGERRAVGTFAAVTLGLRRGTARWLGGGRAPLLLDRLDVRIEILRSRLGGAAGPVSWIPPTGSERRCTYAA